MIDHQFYDLYYLEYFSRPQHFYENPNYYLSNINQFINQTFSNVNSYLTSIPDFHSNLYQACNCYAAQIFLPLPTQKLLSGCLYFCYNPLNNYSCYYTSELTNEQAVRIYAFYPINRISQNFLLCRIKVRI